MVYRQPTYEEYCKATRFARIRYRYGVFIQTIAVFLFVLLLIYTISNIEEMKANPKEYAEEHMDIVCMPANINILDSYDYGSGRNIKDTGLG